MLTTRLIPLLLLSMAAVTAPVSAQDRPTVFIHGLKSSADTWHGENGNDGTAESLANQLAISYVTPTLRWDRTFNSQADELEARPDIAPGEQLAIGHSNGGIVARLWARQRSLSGLVTIGTPNFGAPFVTNAGQYAQYNTNAAFAMFDAADALVWLANNRGDPAYGLPCCDWWSVVYDVFSVLDIPVWTLNYGFCGALGAIGGDIAKPVFGDMQPNSLFIADLNSATSLDWEASTVPTRVSVVSSSGFRGGPVRLWASDSTSDAVGWGMQAAALALYFASDTIYYRSDFDDWDAQDVANRLWVAGQYLDEFDYAWCAAVSTVGMWGCDYNDAIVPISSQLDPTAIMVYTGAEHGPPHTREIDEAKSWIIEAMTVWSNVAYRPSERPPPPPPPPPAPDRLLPYESLHPYQGITSADGRFSLIYQDDGNLVLYRLADWTPLWASNTYGTSAGEVIMQGDGLLVIYDGPLGNGGNPVWTSGTWNIWVTPNRAPQQRQSGRVHG